jgi:HK97 gp10 family phage protein
MADGVRVEVLGADTLARTLSSAARELQQMTPVNRQAGDILARNAASGAPRRTGRLAGSIRVTANAEGAEVTAGAPYAPFQEFGTRYVRATYFLSQAAARDDQVVDVYDRAVDKIISSVRGQ